MKLWSYARHGAVEQAILNELCLLEARATPPNGVVPDDAAAAVRDLITRSEFDEALARMLERGTLFRTSTGRLRVKSASVHQPRALRAIEHFR